jgi:hypothetical protein
VIYASRGNAATIFAAIAICVVVAGRCRRHTADGAGLADCDSHGVVAMKLYDVPRDSRIQLSDGTQLNFKRIDGMYSLCMTDDNEPVHVAAWTEVAVMKKEAPQ